MEGRPQDYQEGHISCRCFCDCHFSRWTLRSRWRFCVQVSSTSSIWTREHICSVTDYSLDGLQTRFHSYNYYDGFSIYRCYALVIATSNYGLEVRCQCRWGVPFSTGNGCCIRSTLHYERNANTRCFITGKIQLAR